MNTKENFLEEFHRFYSALEHLRVLDSPEPTDEYQSALQIANGAYSHLQTALDEFAEDLGSQQLRLDSGIERKNYQKGPGGFARERFQRRLASFRLFAQRHQWEVVAHALERNAARPFTVISDDSIILIELNPHGGIRFCGKGAALQDLSAWAKQENPHAADFSESPPNYPLVKQFQRLSMPYRRKLE